jgi:beta-glucosidase
VTPFDGITAKSQAAVEYTVGYGGYDKLPLLSSIVAGMKMCVYATPPSDPARQKIDETPVPNTDIMLFDYYPPLPTSHRGAWHADIVGSMTPEATGEYEFSLSVAGTARLYIDGILLVDLATKQKAAGSFFGFGSSEVTGTTTLKEGTAYTIKVRNWMHSLYLNYERSI